MDNLTPIEELAVQADMEQQQETLDQQSSNEVADILSAETEDIQVNESIEELTQKYEAMTREEIVAVLKELCAGNNFEALKSKSNILRTVFNEKTSVIKREALEKFIAEGGVEEDFKREQDDVEKEFHALYADYREKRQKHIEQQEKEKQDNLVKKQEVLVRLRELLQSEGSLKEIYDSFNEIQEQWKAIGAVPRTEINGLWESYRFLIEQFFDKVKISKELRDMGLKKNLDEKLALCERVESLMLETSINESFKQLQECHQLWKEIGPVPSDKNDEIWERFKNASDAVNKRRQEFYEKAKEEQNNNLLAKVALCEKLEELLKTEPATIKQWNEQTESVNELFKLWKTIGVVPKSDNESVWERFKKPIDLFFERKKEAFAKLKSEQDTNYNKKMEICAKAEAIAEREDWKVATAELIALQNEWKTIGYVPRKQSEKLWTRFRAACDKFFERKAENYKQQKESEAENIAKKEALIRGVKEFVFTEDKQKNLETIKDFQRQWAEIGYVSQNERERLWKEFRQAIDAHFDKLQSNNMELNLNAFKAQIDAGATEGKKGNFAREKKNLQDQLQKLKSDLLVWENNLGFLAQSKQAELLKAEFDKKMEKTKSEIALIQAKLNILNKEEKVSESQKEEK